MKKEDLEIITEEGIRQCRSWECPEFRIIEPTRICDWKMRYFETGTYFADECGGCNGFDYRCLLYENNLRGGE